MQAIMQTDDIWQTTLGQLQLQMPRTTYDTWVKHSQGLAYEDGTFVVGVPNGYARDWLEERLHNMIKRTLQGVHGRSVEVRYVVWTRAAGELLAGEDFLVAQEVPGAGQRTGTGRAEEPAGQDTARLDVPYTLPSSAPQNSRAASAVGVKDATGCEALSARYTFDRFVVGRSNRLAHAAAMAVAENPARAYNPLFLYGAVGLGKTHLLHAIGHAMCARGLHILYISSEQFTNDLIAAIKAHTTDQFREHYRTADVLLVDDIQFIAGKESTQEEFFHTFNTLHGQDRQIVVSSDRPPKALLTLEDRLRSRFEWGLIADIQPPDLETKVAILKKKAEAEAVPLPDNVAIYIASKIKSNIRELEGSLIRLIAYASLTGSEMSLALAQDVLKNILDHDEKAVTIEIVQKHVADFYQLKLAELKSRNNSKSVAMPRQIAMYLCKNLTQASLPEIGRSFGGKHHSTVIHSIRKVELLRKRDRDFNSLINNFIESFR